MKKIFLYVLISFCVQTSQAKQNYGIDLGIGIKGGLNLNKMTGKGLKDVYSTDPHAGFFAHLNKKRLGIQVEGVWSQNRIVTDSSFYGFYKQYYKTASDSLDEGAFRFQTLAIPILLNIKLSESIWIQAGPQFTSNINVLDKSKILKSGMKVINDGTMNGVLGLWFQFGGKSPVLHVNAGARFIVGINNMSELVSQAGNLEKWRNQMIQFHLGISY
jgi:hypothetical protein